MISNMNFNFHTENEGLQFLRTPSVDALGYYTQLIVSRTIKFEWQIILFNIYFTPTVYNISNMQSSTNNKQMDCVVSNF